MDKKRLFEKFKKSRFARKAEEKSEDEEYLNKIKRSSFRLLSHVKKAKSQVTELIDLVFGKGTSPGNRISAIAALIYFIAPLDFIPDIIPGLGYTEDIAIIGMVIGMITNKLVKARKGTSGEKNAEDEDKGPRIVESEIVEDKKKKFWYDKHLDGLFHKVGRHVEKTTQESIDKRMKAQFIIVAISLGGAIIAAVITLLLKYVFKVF